MKITSLVLAGASVLAAGEAPVLMDFYADWCGPCRQMSRTVSQLEQQGYRIERVNIEEQPQLAQQYHIQAVPTFVALRERQEVGRIVGVTTDAKLRRLMDSAKPAAATAAAPTGGVPGTQPSAAGNTPAAESGRGTQSAGNTPLADSGRGTQPLADSGCGTQKADVLAASVRVGLRDGHGISYGSGTVIHSTPQESLILTCGHIFREWRGDGSITLEVFKGGRPEMVRGQLVQYDLEADIGLIRAQPGRVLPAVRVAPRSYRPQAGCPVTTVGCDHGTPPSERRSWITAVNRYLGPANLECAGLPAQGRSGGGLFVPEGYVVGVCTAADPSEQKGLYTGLAAIHAMLDAERLTAVYDARESGVELAAADTPGRQAKVQAVSNTRAELGGQAAEGATSQRGTPPTTQGPTSVENVLSQDEAEVVCVIRSLKDSRERSKIVVLDHASPGFLAQLEREKDTQAARQLTALRLLDRPTERPIYRVSFRKPESSGWRAMSAERWPSALGGVSRSAELR